MSTEVEAYQAPAASELEQWGRDLRVAYQASRQLVTTSFVPKTYGGKPEEAAAAILTGQELGLSPLAALRSIDIISGVPAMRAVAMRALVQSAGHEIWTEESTKTQAIVCGRRKGSDKVERSVWTIDRARDLQLLGKDNWKKQPIAMLLARATSELVRLIAADVLLGVPYSVEEVIDQGEAEAEAAGPVEEAAPKRAARTVKRQGPVRKPEAQPEPPRELVGRKSLFEEPPLPGEEEPRDWLGEARAAESRTALQALVTEAADAGVSADVLQEMAVFEDSLPLHVVDTDWNAAAAETSGEVL